MIRWKLILWCLILIFELSAQDVHYSMPTQFPLLLNPAQIGNFEGSTRLNLIFRNQNIAVPNPAMPGIYNSYGLSIDTKIFAEKMGDNTWAIGAYFNGDHAGQGTLSTHDFHIGSSYRLSLNRMGSSFLAAGGCLGLTARRLFRDDLVFENQVEGFEFNPNIPNFEDYSADESRILFNYSIGVIYQQLFTDRIGIQAGISIYNLNAPRDFFLENSSSRTYKRTNVFIGMQLDTDDDADLQLFPSVLYSSQGNMSQTNLGLSAKKKLDDTKTAIVGLRYRIADAFIPMVGIGLGKYQIIASYDFTSSGLSTANKSMGAFELGMQIVWGYDPIFGSTNRQFCPQF